MGTIYYFIPNVNQLKPDHLTKAGLEYIIPESQAMPAHNFTTGGKYGGGVVFAYGGKDKRAMINQFMDKGIDFTEIENGSELKVFVAVDPEYLPTPTDLAREKQQSGYDVELADGNTWLIPSARYLERTVKKEGGNWIEGDVLPPFRNLEQRAIELWDILKRASEVDPQHDTTIDINNGFDTAALALSTNYRVSEAEATVLGLFTLQNLRSMIDAIVDLPFWDEYSKKNSPIESLTTDSQPLTAGVTD